MARQRGRLLLPVGGLLMFGCIIAFGVDGFLDVHCPTSAHCVRDIVEQTFNLRTTMSELAKHSAPVALDLSQLMTDKDTLNMIQTENKRNQQVVRWLGIKERQVENLMKTAGHLLATLRPVVDETLFYGGGGDCGIGEELPVSTQGDREEIIIVEASTEDEEAGSSVNIDAKKVDHEDKSQRKQSNDNRLQHVEEEEGKLDIGTIKREMYLDKLEVLHHILNRCHRLKVDSSWKLLEELEDSVVLLYDLFKEEVANQIYNTFEGEDEEAGSENEDVKATKTQQEGKEGKSNKDAKASSTTASDKEWRDQQRKDLFKWIDSELNRWSEKTKKGPKGIDGLFGMGRRTFSFSSSATTAAEGREPNELEKIVAKLLQLQTKKKQTKSGEYVLDLGEEESELKDKLLELWSSGKYNDQIKVVTWTYDGKSDNNTEEEVADNLASSFPLQEEEEEEEEDDTSDGHHGEEEDEEDEEGVDGIERHRKKRENEEFDDEEDEEEIMVL